MSETYKQDFLPSQYTTTTYYDETSSTYHEPLSLLPDNHSSNSARQERWYYGQTQPSDGPVMSYYEQARETPLQSMYQQSQQTYWQHPRNPQQQSIYSTPINGLEIQYQLLQQREISLIEQYHYQQQSFAQSWMSSPKPNSDLQNVTYPRMATYKQLLNNRKVPFEHESSAGYHIAIDMENPIESSTIKSPILEEPQVTNAKLSELEVNKILRKHELTEKKGHLDSYLKPTFLLPGNKCTGCLGSGMHRVTRLNGSKVQRFRTICPECNGDGHVNESWNPFAKAKIRDDSPDQACLQAVETTTGSPISTANTTEDVKTNLNATHTKPNELDVDKIVNNPKLRHDINFDPDLHFKPNFDGEKGQRMSQVASDYWKRIWPQVQKFMTDFEQTENKFAFYLGQFNKLNKSSETSMYAPGDLKGSAGETQTSNPSVFTEAAESDRKMTKAERRAWIHRTWAEPKHPPLPGLTHDDLYDAVIWDSTIPSVSDIEAEISACHDEEELNTIAARNPFQDLYSLRGKLFANKYFPEGLTSKKKDDTKANYYTLPIPIPDIIWVVVPTVYGKIWCEYFSSKQPLDFLNLHSGL